MVQTTELGVMASCGIPENLAMNQPELIPIEHTTSTITVNGNELARIERQLRDMGAVLLGFSANGSTYTLTVILPPGEMLSQALEGRR